MCEMKMRKLAKSSRPSPFAALPAFRFVVCLFCFLAQVHPPPSPLPAPPHTHRAHTAHENIFNSGAYVCAYLALGVLCWAGFRAHACPVVSSQHRVVMVIHKHFLQHIKVVACAVCVCPFRSMVRTVVGFRRRRVE